MMNKLHAICALLLIFCVSPVEARAQVTFERLAQCFQRTAELADLLRRLRRPSLQHIGSSEYLECSFADGEVGLPNCGDGKV